MMKTQDGAFSQSHHQPSHSSLTLMNPDAPETLLSCNHLPRASLTSLTLLSPFPFYQ